MIRTSIPQDERISGQRYAEPLPRSGCRGHIVVIALSTKQSTSYESVAQQLGCSFHVTSSCSNLPQSICRHGANLLVVDIRETVSYGHLRTVRRAMGIAPGLRVIIVCPAGTQKRLLMPLGITDCVEIPPTEEAGPLLPWLDSYLPIPASSN